MTSEESPAVAGPSWTVAPGPHIASASLTTRRMMLDVLIALVPLCGVAVWMFGRQAVFQLVLAGGAALAAETLFMAMRGRKATLTDGSALVTGLILGLSLPATAPWYVPVLGSFTAIGLGKTLFGGLGQNLFNPAMVGRAFVMIAFPAAMGATAYVQSGASLDALTQATPLTSLKMSGGITPLAALVLGTTNGSIGETSAIACLIGGLYLCLRRTASWEIPVGAVAALVVCAGIAALFRPGADWTLFHDLASGAFLFGAFFILTDPVSSPLTPKGKFLFGIGYGLLVLMMRRLSAYPEGVMFSVLIMNAVVPLINRATIPVPVGGPVPERKPS
jgi:electron transport complex protein RnfD